MQVSILSINRDRVKNKLLELKSVKLLTHLVKVKDYNERSFYNLNARYILIFHHSVYRLLFSICSFTFYTPSPFTLSKEGNFPSHVLYSPHSLSHFFHYPHITLSHSLSYYIKVFPLFSLFLALSLTIFLLFSIKLFHLFNCLILFTFSCFCIILFIFVVSNST